MATATISGDITIVCQNENDYNLVLTNMQNNVSFSNVNGNSGTLTITATLSQTATVS